MNMFVQLHSMLKAIKKRDNKVIDTMLTEFTDYSERDFIRPKYNSKEMASSLINHSDFTITDVITNTENKNCHGFKVDEGSYEIWVKFKDVRIRRRKIYKIGDYYLRLVNNAYSKWQWKFYTIEPVLNNEGVIEHKFISAIHPHIQTGIPCMADWQVPVKASLNGYSFISCLEKFQLYLNTWTYNSPHYRPEQFERIIRAVHHKIMPTMYEITNPSVGYQYYERASVLKEKYDIERPWVDNSALLPSARKKAYDTEPLGRLILTYNRVIHPLNEEKIRPITLSEERKKAVYSLYGNFDKFCKTPHYAELTNSEKYVVAYNFVKLLNDNTIVKKEYEGTWTESMSSIQRKINAKVSGQYSMYFNKRRRGSVYPDYESFSPSLHEVNKEDKNVCLIEYSRITSLLNKLTQLHDDIQYGPNVDINSFLHAWGECWKDGKVFNDYMEMIDYAKNSKSNKKTVNIQETFDKIINQINERYDYYAYVFNKSYKKKLQLQYAELSAYVEKYEKEREAINGNENNHSEENTSSSETLTSTIS